ncbi:hypothetical protein FRC02_008210 [Tulasnella sp. 418]|nr:hypothetical protein FRC02_008210 [Tulasnella sp. 418]
MPAMSRRSLRSILSHAENSATTSRELAECIRRLEMRNSPSGGQPCEPVAAAVTSAHTPRASGSRMRVFSLTRSSARDHPYSTPRRAITGRSQTTSPRSTNTTSIAYMSTFANSQPILSANSSIPFPLPRPSTSQAAHSASHHPHPILQQHPPSLLGQNRPQALSSPQRTNGVQATSFGAMHGHQSNVSQSSSIPFPLTGPSTSQAAHSIPPAPQVPRTVFASLPSLPGQNLLQAPLQRHDAVQMTPFGAMDNQAGFPGSGSSQFVANNLEQFPSGFHQSGLQSQSTAVQDDNRYAQQIASPVPRPAGLTPLLQQSFLLAETSGPGSHQFRSNQPDFQAHNEIVEVSASSSTAQHPHSTPVGYPAPSDSRRDDIRDLLPLSSRSETVLDDYSAYTEMIRLCGLTAPPDPNGGRVINSEESANNGDALNNAAQPSQSTSHSVQLDRHQEPPHRSGVPGNGIGSTDVEGGSLTQASFLIEPSDGGRVWQGDRC